MDSKVVDGALREPIWPALKQAGFRRRTGRTAWRDQGEAVQCVNVQSFNSYLADGMGATTFSFGVHLGAFYDAIATRSAMGGFVHDRTRPKEYQCHLRKVLMKGFAQPNLWTRPRFGLGRRRPTLGKWSDRPDVWLVLPDGSNVEVVVRDALDRLLADGLPWLDRVSEPGEAIRRFFEEPDVFVRRGIVAEWYGGTLGSPSRWRSIAALAAARRDWKLLEMATNQMSRQAYWRDHPKDLDAFGEELRAGEVSETTTR